MNINNNVWYENQDLSKLFADIGLANSNGLNYTAKLKKHKQVFKFIEHLEKALNKLSSKREIVLVDCGCGKSYLSLIANYYFTRVQKRKIKFYCIDYNEQVIKSAAKAALLAGFTNMDFICNDIFKVDLNQKADIVYSLHACDTATDMTMAKGIIENANYIFTVSCCQHTVRNNIKHHSLGSITRHGIYKERLSDMVADSMRALILERLGYKVSLFEYVASSETPKNIMIRAIRNGTVSKTKLNKFNLAYEELRVTFNTEPKLNKFISAN